MSLSFPQLTPYTGTALPFLLAILLLFLRRITAKSTPKQMALNIKWGRERFTLPLPTPDTKLAAIREVIADYTHLPLHGFKLIHAGAIMKDDNAPMTAYHIKPNSTITVIGSAEPFTDKPQQPAEATESSIIAKINSELSQVRNILLPALQAYLTTVPSPENKDALRKEHLRLSELLLQSLLRLDAIHADNEWEEARRTRKEAVKEVQMHLDQLDAGKHNL